MRRILATAAVGVGLMGCSSISNTVAGLTTPQSTISGSNYVYVVHPESKQVVDAYDPTLAGNNVVVGDYFTVCLDFGFLRYLQAVDPYVVVYATSWMGTTPEPTSIEDRHHQLVLVKDGLTPNANLPATDVTLLGPVKLTDTRPVKVSLHVVVLSKQDNEQSIELLETAAGVAGSVSPAASVVGSAAASIGAAVVAQNRDKVEFEHMLTFYPAEEPISIDPDDTTVKTTLGAKPGAFQSDATLREGSYVIVKGESGYRLVPYQHPAYYVWPFNWFGHGVDRESLSFEAKNDSRWLTWNPIRWPRMVVEAPFRVTSELLAPSGITPLRIDPEGEDPTALVVRGHELARRSDSGERRERFSDKSHFVLTVKMRPGGEESFDDLRDARAADRELVAGLTTNRTEALEASNARIAAASLVVRDVFEARRAKAEASAGAKLGVPPSATTLSRVRDPALQDSIVRDAADKAAVASIRDLVAFARRLFKRRAAPVPTLLRAEGETDEAYAARQSAAEEARSARLRALFPDLTAHIQQADAWRSMKAGTPDQQEIWSTAWRRVLANVRRTVTAFPDPLVAEGFVQADWTALERPDVPQTKNAAGSEQ